jgi:hypothetical protein
MALVVLTGLVVMGPTAAVTAAAPAPSTGAPADRALGGTSLQTDGMVSGGTTLAVQLRPNGNARWEVTTSFHLSDDGDRAAFDDLAAEFERGDADVGFSIDTFLRANREANATVDRSMGIRNIERTVTVVEEAGGNATGRLTLAFTWTDFATVGDETYRFGSAFNTSDGTWLPGLAADQRLVVSPPAGYEIDTVPVPVVNGALEWEGPDSFEPSDVSATYVRDTPPTPGSPTPTPTPTPTLTGTTPPDRPGGSGLWLVGGGVGGLLLLAVAVVLFRRRSDDGPAPGPATGDGGEAGGGATTDTAPDGDGAAAAGATDDEPEPDPELLSDEERVERLLERNGGRMKQANIVSETGWSNAKVSQLLSAMDEAGRVNKLRIGRENLISLPDEDITEFDEG